MNQQTADATAHGAGLHRRAIARGRVARAARRAIAAHPLVATLLLLAVETGLLFGSSIDDSLVADDWTIVEAKATSLRSALAIEALGPHFIPLQYLILAALYRVVGVDPLAYHLVVLALVWVSAGLVALLGRRLTGSLGVGAAAAGLFLAYGTHHEAILWPAAGVSYTLATALCLGGLLLYLRAHDAALGATARRAAYAGFLVALLLAPFAYPQGLLLIAGAALCRLFVLEQGVAIARSTLLARGRAWGGDFLAPALIVLGFMAINARAAPDAVDYVALGGVSGHVRGFANSLLYLLPGVGRTEVNDRWAGAESAVGNPELFTAVVAVAIVLVAAALLWRGRPHHRFLGAWIALIVGATVAATGTMFPRHVFLITAPASILWVAVLWEPVRPFRAALVRRGVRAETTAVLAAAPSVAALVALAAFGAAFGVEQRDTWSAASADTNALIGQIDRLARDHPDASSLYLVDPLVGRLSPSGEPAWILPPWSAAATVRMRLPGRFAQAEAVYTRHITRRGWLITEDQLRTLSRDPRVLLLAGTARGNELRTWQPRRALGADLTPTTGDAAGAVDLVGEAAPRAGEAIAVAAGDDLDLVGWAVAGPTAAAGGVLVTVDGRPSARATYGGERADVAERYASPALRAVGVAATVPSGALPPGRHTLGLWVVTPDERSYVALPDLVVVEVAP